MTLDRDFRQFVDDAKEITLDLFNRPLVVIFAPPGAGKTHVVEALPKQLGAQFLDTGMHASLSEPDTLTQILRIVHPSIEQEFLPYDNMI